MTQSEPVQVTDESMPPPTEFGEEVYATPEDEEIIQELFAIEKIVGEEVAPAPIPTNELFLPMDVPPPTGPYGTADNDDPGEIITPNPEMITIRPGEILIEEGVRVQLEDSPHPIIEDADHVITVDE